MTIKEHVPHRFSCDHNIETTWVLPTFPSFVSAENRSDRCHSVRKTTNFEKPKRGDEATELNAQILSHWCGTSIERKHSGGTMPKTKVSCCMSKFNGMSIRHSDAHKLHSHQQCEKSMQTCCFNSFVSIIFNKAVLAYRFVERHSLGNLRMFTRVSYWWSA